MYSNRTKAFVCINLFTILQFAFMLSSKYVMATYNVNGLDYCLFRTIVCLAVHLTMLRLTKQSVRFAREDLLWVVTRNVAGTINLISLIYAIQYLPIGIY